MKFLWISYRTYPVSIKEKSCKQLITTTHHHICAFIEQHKFLFLIQVRKVLTLSLFCSRIFFYLWRQNLVNSWASTYGIASIKKRKKKMEQLLLCIYLNLYIILARNKRIASKKKISFLRSHSKLSTIRFRCM